MSVTWKERQSMQTSVSVQKLKLRQCSTALTFCTSQQYRFLITVLEKTGWFSRLGPEVGQFLFIALPLCINFNQAVIKKIIILLQMYYLTCS